MKINALHGDGFEMGRHRRGQDYVLQAEFRGAVKQLQLIHDNPSGSRISLFRELLESIKYTISSTTIDSDEEKEHMDKISDTVGALQNNLNELKDGPVPHDLLYYISALCHLINDFCDKYARY